MLNFLEQECPICHRPFSKEDDVVVCPYCGAPYHRNCWPSSGQCAFSDKHGTPEQWQPKPCRDDDDAVICSNCGTANVKGSTFCCKCGHALESSSPAHSGNLCVSIAKPNPSDSRMPAVHSQNSDAGSNASRTADRAAFIGRNSEYYLTRFDQMDKQNNRLSWNWCAAFFPMEWLLYRKMYKLFCIVSLLMLVFFLPSFYILVSNYMAMAGNAEAYQNFLASGQVPAMQQSFFLTVVSDAASTLMLFLRGLLALTANYLYRNHVNRCVDKIKQDHAADPLYYRYVLSKKGGTNLTGVILFWAALLTLFAAGSALLLHYIIQ